MATNSVTGKQEIVELAQTIADGTYQPIVPAIVDNLGRTCTSQF